MHAACLILVIVFPSYPYLRRGDPAPPQIRVQTGVKMVFIAVGHLKSVPASRPVGLIMGSVKEQNRKKELNSFAAVNTVGCFVENVCTVRRSQRLQMCAFCQTHTRTHARTHARTDGRTHTHTHTHTHTTRNARLLDTRNTTKKQTKQKNFFYKQQQKQT